MCSYEEATCINQLGLPKKTKYHRLGHLNNWTLFPQTSEIIVLQTAKFLLCPYETERSGISSSSYKAPALQDSVQFSSVTQSCSTLCDPMNHSTPGLPVHHQLLEFTQTHVHRVSDAIQPSHPLSKGFCRRAYWSGLPYPPPGDLPNPGIQPVSLTSTSTGRRVLYRYRLALST